MGPLHGVRVVELASLAPAPFGCMILADLGAEVLRVDRPDRSGRQTLPPVDPLCRGRRSIRLNLKDPAGVDVLLRLTDRADVLVEAFRPGMAERLGFGPDVCAGRNARLIYARMTGWGQDGTLAVAVLAALLERERSGVGQVVDAAMVDGSALLASFLYGLRAAGAWQDERGTNVLDGGAPFYDTYATADGRYMAVGALEPKFFAELLARLGIDAAGLPAQYDRSGWPELRVRLTWVFAGRTQAEWVEVFAGSDACVAPVVRPRDAPGHPHNAARKTFIDVGGVTQPAPAPRFGRTACAPPSPPARPGADTNDVLAGLGFSAIEIARLRDNGAAT